MYSVTLYNSLTILHASHEIYFKWAACCFFSVQEKIAVSCPWNVEQQLNTRPYAPTSGAENWSQHSCVKDLKFLELLRKGVNRQISLSDITVIHERYGFFPLTHPSQLGIMWPKLMPRFLFVADGLQDPRYPDKDKRKRVDVLTTLCLPRSMSMGGLCHPFLMTSQR